MKMLRSNGSWVIAAAVSLTLAGSALAQQYAQEPVQSTVFSDNFSNGFGNWTVGTNTIDHTIFGQTPTLVTNAGGAYNTYAQLKLDTYDPTVNQNGVSYLGTQIQTNQSFGLPTSGGTVTGQGVRYEIAARVESTGRQGPQGNSGNSTISVAQGLNAAAFTYSYSAPKSQNYHDELDFENLTSQEQPRSVTNPNGATTHSNVYFGTSNGDATLDTSYRTTAADYHDNSYYSQYPYVARDTGATAPSNDIYAWHTYDIDWYPTQVDWYVDGQLVREESASELSATNPTLYVPNQSMPYYLNFWAPGSEFADAYSNTLTPSATAAGNTEYYYDVANASVSVVAPLGTPTPEPTSLGMIGISLLGMAFRSKRRVVAKH